MEHYIVKGMSCAACQASIEKAVNAVDGVSNCTVSLLTNSMRVEGTAQPEDIIKAVVDAGYGASLKKEAGTKETDAGYAALLTNQETPRMRNRLVASLMLLLPLMYVSMGHVMWNLPVPGFLEGNPIAIGIYEMLLAGLIMVINQKFFISGFRGCVHKSPNMDTLVALGAMASFGYSVYALFAMSVTMQKGDFAAALQYMESFYFESAAMILTLITLGKMLEEKTKGKTTDALKELMKLSPQTAIVLRDGKEETVSVTEVRPGDLFVVKPGNQIPVDGIVKEGFSAVNESAFTGESVPVDKTEGDTVLAATMNTNGFMVCEAIKVGEDTALSQIIQMVSDAAATKAPIAKIADRVSGIFVPVVILIAGITLCVWLLAGQTFGYALARAISVLVISCPCALGLATPVAIMVGGGVGAKAGILFKTALILEQTGKVQIIALDKTGTVTTGQMQVTDIVPVGEIKEHELIRIAASLEAKSEHPISKAITKKAIEASIALLEVSGFHAVAGNGLKGRIDGKMVYGGNETFINQTVKVDTKSLKEVANVIASTGKTPVYFATDTELLGMLAVADTIKTDSKNAIAHLKRLGLQIVMLTGDNKITANAIAKEIGVDEVIASVKPDEKEYVIKKLMEQGKVAMVGDGINDAPALTRADVGIAIGAGTDVAIDAADIVLTGNSIEDVAAAIRISRATIRNIHENLFWAFIYNIIGIPLAAGCFFGAFGWTLNPMFGAAAMSLSSLCVVTNALRLNRIKMYDADKDKAIKNSIDSIPMIVKNNDKEATKMMKVTVRGMMCGHCEAHVKEALEKINGIEEVHADHNENLVTITTSGEVAEADIKAAVEEAGYEYAGLL